ncbi:MAG: IS200/IS605 family transposase [Anaerolineales bacterium]|jgi:REP element-mobilizing transposase RayT/CheY-like chemotaxis protein
MAIPIIVVTPNAGFGELVCQILEETGKYAVALATTSQEAAAIAKKDRPALCILETGMEGRETIALVDMLRQEVENMLLVLIPSEEGAAQENLDHLSPDGFLSKPFYLPDLVSLIDDVISSSGIEDLNRAKTGPVKSAPLKPFPTNLPPPPDWLKDVSLAAQHLTRLSLETSSQASLITKLDQIWAYAGELPQNATEELARIVAAYFADGGGSDLARFISLEATGNEYMLYASGLGGEYVLAMVFDAEMPFSKIRAQANRLAEGLSTDYPPMAPAEGAAGNTFSSQVDGQVGIGENELGGQENLQPLLDDVPPPIPNDWIPETMVPAARKGFLDELLEDDLSQRSSRADVFSYETQASEIDDGPHRVELAIDEPQATREGEFQNETVLSEAEREAVVAETIKSRVPGKSKVTKVEPVSPSMYNLTYACVLIPRFPHHYLTGAIATRLADWINNMSVAFGWRLEHLSIRPEYMQWMVNVPPNTSPGYLMRTIRQHTSRRMFVEFPRLEEDNPSGDFWAHGYLIMSGTHPPPSQLVKDFIRNTRKRQGINK